jgi:hypothetical protein
MRPHSGNSFHIAMFEGVKFFLEGLDQLDASTGDTSNNDSVDAGGQLRQSGDDGELVKALDGFARQDLVGQSDYPEHIRVKQAETWLAFAACCQRWRGRQSERDRPLPLSLSWTRQSTLAWLNHERSGLIQQTLRQALDKLDSLVYE